MAHLSALREQQEVADCHRPRRAIDRDPGPPYGAAWGNWRRRPRAVVLSDSDISGLVQIQVGHRVIGSSPYDLAYGCGHGRPVPDFVTVSVNDGRD